MAGSMPIFRNKNGKIKPSVVETIMAENIAIPNAKTSRAGSMAFSAFLVFIKIAQVIPPKIPQLNATTRAIRVSREKTCLNFNATRCPVANPETTIADVCNPAFPLIAAIIGTNASAAV